MEERRAVICLPTYDERENLAPILAAIHAAVPAVDVLVVDDNSPDGTGQLADELADPRPAREGPPPPGQAGARPRVPRGFAWALRARLRPRPRDGRGLLPRSAPPAGAARRRARAPTSSSAPGTCRAAAP